MAFLFRRNNGFYYIESRVGMKNVRQSTKTRDEKEAQKIFAQVQATQVRTIDIRYLSGCVREYLQFVQTNLSPGTLRLCQPTLRRFISVLGDCLVAHVDSRAIERYKATRAALIRPTTVNIELRVIKAFFSRLKYWKLVKENPCSGVCQLRVPQEPPAFLTIDQLKTLIDSIHDPWLRDIIVVASMTGMRLGEVLNIEWNDINWDAGTILIRSSEGYRVKGGKMRTIPMNETVAALLQAKTRRDGLVFKGRRGWRRAYGSYVSKKFKEAVRSLGFDERLHFHSLRHTFASLLVQRGVSLYEVQNLLGHSTVAVTQIYAHLQPSTLQATVNKISLNLR